MPRLQRGVRRALRALTRAKRFGGNTQSGAEHPESEEIEL